MQDAVVQVPEQVVVRDRRRSEDAASVPTPTRTITRSVHEHEEDGHETCSDCLNRSSDCDCSDCETDGTADDELSYSSPPHSPHSPHTPHTPGSRRTFPHPPCSASARTSSPHLRQKPKPKPKPPPIEISDAFYDEHPSPEGPATAPAEWDVRNLERLAARRPLGVPLNLSSVSNARPRTGSVVAGSNGVSVNAEQRDVDTPRTTAGGPGAGAGPVDPLWPDYAGSDEELASSVGARRGSRLSSARERGEVDEEGVQTALFIGPFVYDDIESVSSGVGEVDLEKATAVAGAAAAAAGEGTGAGAGEVRAEERQPMGGFDFDGLPARRPGRARGRRQRTKAAKGPSRHSNTNTVATYDASEKTRYNEEKSGGGGGGNSSKRRGRSLSPQSTIESLSTNGRPERWYWLWLEWLQVKCGPGNVVDWASERGEFEHHRRREERVAGDGEGEERRQVQVQQVQKSASSHHSHSKSKSKPSPSNNGNGKSTSRHPRNWRHALRKVYLSVPAFASPLTPILNPLVGRAQWEIVVRSAAVSAVVSCVVVGALVAVPETRV